MANRTVKDATSVKGTNPQYLVEKIIRSRIYDSRYWKEECFALSAELVVDKAMQLKHVGGVFGGNIKPTPFLCLVLKMLQIQPEKDIIVEFIKNEDFKYVRALGAYYMRLTGNSLDCYKYLEPLLNDYRKLRSQNRQGVYELTYMDEFIDQLLREERMCDVILPRIQRRQVHEETGQLEPRVSALDDDLDELAESSGDDEPPPLPSSPPPARPSPPPLPPPAPTASSGRHHRRSRSRSKERARDPWKKREHRDDHREHRGEHRREHRGGEHRGGEHRGEHRDYRAEHRGDYRTDHYADYRGGGGGGDYRGERSRDYRDPRGDWGAPSEKRHRGDYDAPPPHREHREPREHREHREHRERREHREHKSDRRAEKEERRAGREEKRSGRHRGQDERREIDEANALRAKLGLPPLRP